MFSVDADVKPGQRKKARTLTWGGSVTVSKKMRGKLMHLGVKYVPKENKVLIIPPRDFLAAGVQDVKEQMEDEFDRVIDRANAKVTRAMPHIRRPKFVKGTGAAGKGGSVLLAKGYEFGKGGRITGQLVQTSP